MIKFYKQQGIALVVALLVVSLATLLAVALVDHLYYDIRRTENILLNEQAQLYNANAAEFAMVLLKLDRELQNEYDDLEDINLFNQQAAMFPVEGGSVSAKLTDLQSCFNVNNLSKTNTGMARYRTQYKALLGNLEVDINLQTVLTDSLIDWLDPDDISEPQGAEFDYYIGLEQQPYRTANGLMVSPSELRLVKGYTDDVIKLIRDYICVLPVVNTSININTASSIMLNSIQSLVGYGEQIVADRDGDPENPDDAAPFVKIEDFSRYAKDTLKINNFDSTGLQSFSEYFLLQSNTVLGTGNTKLFSMIYRNQNDMKTSIIRQTRGTY